MVGRSGRLHSGGLECERRARGVPEPFAEVVGLVKLVLGFLGCFGC